jgi:FMN phosphatase YigB (HAD superfamily)
MSMSLHRDQQQPISYDHDEMYEDEMDLRNRESGMYALFETLSESTKQVREHKDKMDSEASFFSIRDQMKKAEASLRRARMIIITNSNRDHLELYLNLGYSHLFTVLGMIRSQKPTPEMSKVIYDTLESVETVLKGQGFERIGRIDRRSSGAPRSSRQGYL